jgi:hypothetical protein
MAIVDITPATLIIRITGMHGLWALRSRLEVPLAHVVDAEVAPSLVLPWIRLLGTSMPGAIHAGTFLRGRKLGFCDVRHRDRAIAINLAGERYARLVIEVEDPHGTVAAIRRALGTD